MLLGEKVKVVEKTGVKLESILTSSDPFREGDCGRPDCGLCGDEDSKGQNCRRRNVTYTNTCKICEKKGVKSVYIGETSRSLKERQAEHLNDAQEKKEQSHMWQHSSGEHEGETSFKCKILRSEKSAFERQ